MPFAYTIVALIPLLMAPAHTAWLWQELYRSELNQISVDNAGIELGRWSRTSLQHIQRLNQAIQALEVPHHVAHHCSRSLDPVLAAACLAQDQVLETKIRSLHLSAGSYARMRWLGALVSAEKEFHRRGQGLLAIQYSSRPPHRSKTCPLCFLKTGWEVPQSELPLKAVLTRRGELPRHSVYVYWDKTSQGLWNYRLRVEP